MHASQPQRTAERVWEAPAGPTVGSGGWTKKIAARVWLIRPDERPTRP